MERVAIFVDGENFYHGLRSINPKYTDFKFDFAKFFNTLTTNKRKLVGFWYYTAPIKGSENISLNHSWQLLVARLRKIHPHRPDSVRICERQKRLQIEQDGYEHTRYRFKMDDVWLSVDMLEEAIKNNFDTAILISGDGDIKPSVDKVKSYGKRVELVGFAGTIASALVASCHNCTIIDKGMVRRHFYNPQIQTTLQPKS